MNADNYNKKRRWRSSLPRPRLGELTQVSPDHHVLRRKLARNDSLSSLAKKPSRFSEPASADPINDFSLPLRSSRLSQN